MPVEPGVWYSPPELEWPPWLSIRMMDKFQPAIALQGCASSFTRSLNFKRSYQSRFVCEIPNFYMYVTS